MKKNLLFFVPSAIICALLFMLRVTGMPAHIAISVVGLVLMLALTVLTKKTWKIPVLEVLMRASYLVALVSGIVLMKVSGVAALPIIHKLSAALFAILLVVIFVHKMIKKNSKDGADAR